MYTRGERKIVSFRGTRPEQVQALESGQVGSDLIADLKLGLGINTSYFSEGEVFVARHAQSSHVALVGHSLGGAVAQTVGNRLRLPFVTFNAPGVAVFASRNIGSANPGMASLRAVGNVISAFSKPGQALRDMTSAFYSVTGLNIRLSGDVISQIGVHYGRVETLQSAHGAAESHGMETVLSELRRRSTQNRHFPENWTVMA